MGYRKPLLPNYYRKKKAAIVVEHAYYLFNKDITTSI